MTTVTGSSPFRSLAIVGVLFFIIGFFTWINGPLITFVQLAFDLDEVNAFLVLMVFYLSYFFLALPAAALLKRTGMKKGLAASLFVMAVGAAMFGEFSTQRWYPGALSGLFGHRRQPGAAADRGEPLRQHPRPHRERAQRIALMGICNKVAGILARSCSARWCCTAWATWPRRSRPPMRPARRCCWMRSRRRSTCPTW